MPLSLDEALALHDTAGLEVAVDALARTLDFPVPAAEGVPMSARLAAIARGLKLDGQADAHGRLSREDGSPLDPSALFAEAVQAAYGRTPEDDRNQPARPLTVSPRPFRVDADEDDYDYVPPASRVTPTTLDYPPPEARQDDAHEGGPLAHSDPEVPGAETLVPGSRTKAGRTPASE